MTKYKNPILYCDYADPDICRAGTDYFMVASSFCNAPALPILHSKDLVHWKVVSYVLEKLPFDIYNTPQHGKGVWAPAIRYHDGLFWVMYPMPDEGIFVCTTKDPFGTWSEPVTVRAGSGWIDPCPFWDDDGKAYMVSAFAKSRIGFKSILNMAEMKPDCSGLIDDGKHIFDGHNTQPTIEGPKLYKRNGYYYILAPAGGVKHGWQTALRSKNIYGPYEEKIVMMQGGADINGPHQGGLVDTPSGQWWFVHFQDAGAAGRIVHLQPVSWVDDWPIIGDDSGGEGCGSPVRTYIMPDVGCTFSPISPDVSDEFEHDELGLQWQWNANPAPQQYNITNSAITLNAMPYNGALCDAPHLLLQKYMAPSFEAVAKIDITNLSAGSSAGLVVLGRTYGALALHKNSKGIDFVHTIGQVEKDFTETIAAQANITGDIYLKLSVQPCMTTTFSYSIDNQHFIPLGETFISTTGFWVGSKFGFYCTGDRGSIAIDWVRVDYEREQV